MFHTLPDGSKMYYEVQGNLDADKTLVFLGGLSQSTIAWGGYLPKLKENYRIVLVDLIFQGQSDAPAEARSFEDHANEVKHLLDALKFENVYLIGISYGGAVSLRLLVNYPDAVTKSIIMASFAHKPPMFDAFGVSWFSALQAGGYPLMLDVMLPAVLGRSYFENPLIPIEAIKTGRRDLHLPTTNLMKLMQATAESGDYRKELAKIKVPVRVIVGEEDILCTPAINQAIADHIPNSDLKRIPKAGHTLNLEAIPQTMELIIDFVESTVTV
ncbi:alpha/beta hydrolase [uncultured Microscilla sp.]|uniref:alpha/beta fold hydrolase n=1 Tax=uncultured Microscilla sp. TaxID=432653 RepID=UPI00262B00A2|nr:alpha/beta hydrolase [uncultured Microscilla sp.]